MPTADRARFIKCLYLFLSQIIAFLSIAKMYSSDRLPSISISSTCRKTKIVVSTRDEHVPRLDRAAIHFALQIH
ncbi:hypothetical protein [Chamaesiphon sp.]|uniref:hypothetical protein n=1 Tax=Chamaesiphon sp. TaxID=2814140 RepID=UPI0035944CF5